MRPQALHLLAPHLLAPHLLAPHLLAPHLLAPHLLAPHLLALSLVAGCSAAVDDNEARAGDDGAAGRGAGGGGGVDGTLPDMYCDGCSAVSMLQEMAVGGDDLINYIIDSSGLTLTRDAANVMGDPASYYDSHEAAIRTNVERSMGAKVAFLVMAWEGSGQSCFPHGTGCFSDDDCCSPDVCDARGMCAGGPFCNGYGSECYTNADCCSHNCKRAQHVLGPGACRSEVPQ